MNEKEALLMIKGLLSEATDEERSKVEECKKRIIAIMQEYDEYGKLAVVLVNLETLNE